LLRLISNRLVREQKLPSRRGGAVRTAARIGHRDLGVVRVRVWPPAARRRSATAKPSGVHRRPSCTTPTPWPDSRSGRPCRRWGPVLTPPARQGSRRQRAEGSLLLFRISSGIVARKRPLA